MSEFGSGNGAPASEGRPLSAIADQLVLSFSSSMPTRRDNQGKRERALRTSEPSEGPSGEGVIESRITEFDSGSEQ